MIKSLTDDQRKQLKIYKDKYIKICLNTDRINKEECRNDIDDFYVKILKRSKPRKIIFCKSPYQLWNLLCYFKFYVKIAINKVKNKKTIIKKVLQGVDQEVWQEVYQEVWQEVDQEVEREVNQEVLQEVNQEVRQKVGQECKIYLFNFVYSYLYGAFDSLYFSFYSFVKDVLGIKFKNIIKFNICEKLLNYGFIYPLKNVCFISEKPTGHAHVLCDTIDKVETFKHGNIIYLRVKEPVILKHEEHKQMTIVPGDYMVDRVKEYDPWEKEIRMVRD